MYARWTMQQVLRALVVAVAAAFVSYVSRKFPASCPRISTPACYVNIQSRVSDFFPLLIQKNEVRINCLQCINI